MKIFCVAFVTAVLLIFSPCQKSLHAHTIFITGTVTKPPWLDRYYRMEVDGIPYTFMPKVQIDADFTDYNAQEMTEYLARQFKVGVKLGIAKQGFRIYRVEFTNK